MKNPGGLVTYSVTGTGSQVKVVNVYAPTSPLTGPGWSARICYFFLREDAGGGATSVDIKVCHRNLVLTDGMSYTGIADDYIAMEAPSIALTASATDASLDSPLDTPRITVGSLGIVFNVTAVGAWTLRGFLETSS